MARPKKEDELGDSTFLGLRISGHMRKALEASAKASGNELSHHVRVLLMFALQDERWKGKK